MRPQLDIQRLVLTGFSPADAARVRDAFVRTLQDEAAQAVVRPQAGSGPAGRRLLSLPRPGSPAAIGRDAARALLQSLQGDTGMGPAP